MSDVLTTWEALIWVWDGVPATETLEGKEYHFPHGKLVRSDWMLPIVAASVERARDKARHQALAEYPGSNPHILSVFKDRAVVWRAAGQ